MTPEEKAAIDLFGSADYRPGDHHNTLFLDGRARRISYHKLVEWYAANPNETPDLEPRTNHEKAD